MGWLWFLKFHNELGKVFKKWYQPPFCGEIAILISGSTIINRQPSQLGLRLINNILQNDKWAVWPEVCHVVGAGSLLFLACFSCIPKEFLNKFSSFMLLNPIPLDILRFRAETMPQIKRKCHVVLNCHPIEGNWVYCQLLYNGDHCSDCQFRSWNQFSAHNEWSL